MVNLSRLLIFVGLVVSSKLPHDACSSLSQQQVALPDNVIWQATSVAVGELEVGSTAYNNTVAICRVVGSIKYGCNRNDTLNFEAWLPDESRYNQRYVSVGNGGFAGTIDYASMLSNLNSGYAVGGCDSGHLASENGASKPGSYVPFLHNRAETLAWIHNSIAMFTEPVKALATRYYRKGPKKMYYAGCSTGGAQGFALAQFHPHIFDGIYAGSPGNYYSHLILSFLWNGLNSENPGAFMSASALQLITNAVLDACDGLDGTVDRLIEDPSKCEFNVTSLRCANGQDQVVDGATVCLSAAQIKNAENFYAGPTDPRTGKQIYPGFAPGSEIEWAPQESSLYLQYAVPILQNLVFKNLSRDYTTFNWASDLDAVDKEASPLIDEISPDLRAFKKRGGKMIVTQGWADPFNAPGWPIQQRAEMLKIFGNDLSSFYSLFMIPGGGHCGAPISGYTHVPATYHVLDQLVPWVEEGHFPTGLLTTNPPDGSGSTSVIRPYV